MTRAVKFLQARIQRTVQEQAKTVMCAVLLAQIGGANQRHTYYSAQIWRHVLPEAPVPLRIPSVDDASLWVEQMLGAA
jgi:hypothetical protein